MRGESANSGLIPSPKPHFSELLKLSYWKWRESPAIMVPAMFSAAVAVASQGVLFLFLMVILSGLASAGAMKGLAEALQRASPEEILRALAQPEILQVVVPASAAALIIFFAVNILGAGFATSAEYGTYLSLLKGGKVDVGDVLRELGRRWSTMAWTVLLVNVVAWAPLCIAFLSFLYFLVHGAFLVPASASSEPGTMIGVLASSLAILVLAIIGLVVYSFSIYSYPAVVISGTRGLKAFMHSLTVFRSTVGISVAYVLVRIGVMVSLGVLVVLAEVGVSLYSLITAVISLFLVPILHLLKTQVYFMHSQLPLPPLPFVASTTIVRDLVRTVPRRLMDEIRRGLKTLEAYVAAPSKLPYHLASLLLFLCGMVGGCLVSSSGLSEIMFAAGYRSGRINPEVTTAFPPTLGVDISFHNWQVSLATALSGLALTLPAAISLVFNGFLLGVLASLTPRITMFLAAILPHGVIELPCFFVAGSAGVRLGVETMKAWRRGGVWHDPSLRMALRETVYIVIGLAPFFLVAGLVEALVTPPVMRYFGWG